MPPPRTPRVAFFPDSFHEVNGVAHTARQFTAWAERTGRSFLCVRAGQRFFATQNGSVHTLELPRSFASFPLDKDLRYDPIYARHARTILQALRAFRPDIVHITGPSELGMLGAALAHHLGVPLAASWHTNVHEYAAQRSAVALRLLPASQRPPAGNAIQEAALKAAALFYKSARILFAPNPNLCALLTARTGRPCSLMARGIDADLFSPTRRTALLPSAALPPQQQSFTLGYVGRLSVEKNVALLPVIAEQLQALGFTGVRLLIVGQGAQESALRSALPTATFAGVLRGPALAEAYANMDCFLFPSHTDTFGNVVLEALASGVPAVVTPDGGPAHIVASSNSMSPAPGAGLIAPDTAFADAVASILSDPARLACMRLRARAYAETASWDAVFAAVYQGYQAAGL